MNKQKSLLWTFKMAWRDSRSNRSKLFLFMAAIIVGVAAQVAITSFRANLNTSIENQAKEMINNKIVSSKKEWFTKQLSFVEKHEFFTKTARMLREVSKEEQAKKLKELI